MNSDLTNLFQGAYPGFLDQARASIAGAESDYTGGQGASFLVDHTEQVMCVAYKLAREEGIDPLRPVLTALFHDAGKFVAGAYHRDPEPEEEASARVAEELMGRYGFEAAIVETVSGSIRALYRQDAPKTRETDLVHDADFLVKFGWSGVAQYFIKGALRGGPLLPTLRRSLSKELTYAAVLTDNMRTRAGKRRARTKQTRTLRYFEGLLRELEEDGILVLRMEEFQVAAPGAKRPIPVVIAKDAVCPGCGGDTRVAFDYEAGVKCVRMIADVACRTCATEQRIAFCLPEIPHAAK